jgi:hypothetical protein
VNTDRCFAIMYDSYDEGHNTTQVADVCATLELAVQWLVKERQGKSWSNSSYLDGDGLRTRVITEFGKNRWTSYSIRETNFIS